MERLPQKFEIWKYNADEDKKVLDFCTEEVKEEIDKVSDSIKEWFCLWEIIVGWEISVGWVIIVGWDISVGGDFSVGKDHQKIAVEAITAVYNQQVDLNSTHESKINAFQKTKNGITRLKGFFSI